MNGSFLNQSLGQSFTQQRDKTFKKFSYSLVNLFKSKKNARSTSMSVVQNDRRGEITNKQFFDNFTPQ